MPWVRTRDILNLSMEFYRHMRFFFEGFNYRDHTQRMGMLLDAVRRHVENLERELLCYEKEASNEVLDAWFQFSPDPPELNIDPTERIRTDMTIDDMLGITLDFDTALSEFYKRVYESTEFEAVGELFLNLKNSVVEEKKKLALDTSGLKQL